MPANWCPAEWLLDRASDSVGSAICNYWLADLATGWDATYGVCCMHAQPTEDDRALAAEPRQGA
jgi:hypothetical protein